MALILNIETSTSVCSIALAKDGKLIDYKEINDDKSHAKVLTVFIQEIFSKNNIEISKLDAVSVSKGPGSYTGLRIGISVAKGICYGQEIPLIAINTLQALAKNIFTNTKTPILNTLAVPMIDARRMEVYSAIYNFENNELQETKAIVIDEHSFLEQLSKQKLIFFGNGAEKCKSTISHKNAIFVDNYFCSAKNMIQISENKFNNKKFEDLAYFKPFYLKSFIAIKSTKNILGK